jgi:transcriptional regulator with XRE-family HTH domain
MAQIQTRPVVDKQRLILARIEAGYTPRELSRHIGRSETFISGIEHGHRGVSPRALKDIAGALGVKVADLLAETEKAA